MWLLPKLEEFTMWSSLGQCLWLSFGLIPFCFQMTPEELNSLFCHEVFGSLKGHQCTVCGRVFPYRYQLMVHARYHSLPVSVSNFTSAIPSYFLKVQTHKNRVFILQEENNAAQPVENTGDVVAAAAAVAKEWNGHTLVETLQPPPMPSTAAAHQVPTAGPAPPASNTPKNHICTQCGRGFSRKEHLANHMNRHTGTFL